MTISNETTRSSLYTHDGVEDTFTFPFDTRDADEVVVYQSSDGGFVETRLEAPTNFTVTLNATPPGGQIVWDDVSGFDSTFTFRIVRESPKTQDLKVTNTSEYHPAALEPALDSHVRLDQASDDGRVLKVQHTSVEDPDDLVKLIRTNATLIAALQNPKLLLDELVATAISPVPYLQVSSPLTLAYDRIELEIPLAFMEGVSANRTIIMQGFNGTNWTSSGFKYALKAHSSDNLETPIASDLSSITQQLTLTDDYDRFDSHFSGNIIMHRTAQHGFVDLAYAISVAGSHVTAVRGTFSTIDDIQGFRVYVAGAPTEMVGTVRLWGIPKV